MTVVDKGVSSCAGRDGRIKASGGRAVEVEPLGGGDFIGARRKTRQAPPT